MEFLFRCNLHDEDLKALLGRLAEVWLPVAFGAPRALRAACSIQTTRRALSSSCSTATASQLPRSHHSQTTKFPPQVWDAVTPSEPGAV